uniref:Translation initiation factor 5A-like N-terminal domain-containing protein n=1 Tax=Ditylenchus dipsaci TaxID=166011 RepID=A0A915CSF7_9BILA
MSHNEHDGHFDKESLMLAPINRNSVLPFMSTSNLEDSQARIRQVHMLALDIFTNKKLENICPSTHSVVIPVIKRKEYQLLSINEDEFLGLIDLETREIKLAHHSFFIDKSSLYLG